MKKPPRLRINEIFHSVQGEGTRTGLRCVFIRLTGCHLRCTFCDSEHAFYKGNWMTLDALLDRVRQYDCPVVEVTGGEPLLQPAVFPLMKTLADECETVLLETSGSLSIAEVDPRVVRIVDIKCPASGEALRNRWASVTSDAPRAAAAAKPAHEPRNRVHPGIPGNAARISRKKHWSSRKAVGHPLDDLDLVVDSLQQAHVQRIGAVRRHAVELDGQTRSTHPRPPASRPASARSCPANTLGIHPAAR